MKIKTTNRENLIINALKETEEKRALQIPEGYAEIALSSKGKLGAPELFHIRNFKVGEVMSLAQTKESDLSQRLTSILNEMILEDVDVKDWHESEVLETMVYVYMIFFQPVLRDVYFPVNQEDLNYLESQGRTDEAQYIREGKQKPLVEINIADGVTTYDLPDNFKRLSELRIQIQASIATSLTLNMVISWSFRNSSIDTLQSRKQNSQILSKELITTIT